MELVHLESGEPGTTIIVWDHGVLIQTASLSLVQGAMAGLIGGFAMAIAMAALAASVGENPWILPQRLAAVIIGPSAKEPRAAPIALGVAVHALLSVGFGALYAIVVDRLTHELWMTSLAYALTLWVLNFWSAQLTPGGRALDTVKTSWLSPLAHIVYGGATAAVALALLTASRGHS